MASLHRTYSNYTPGPWCHSQWSIQVQKRRRAAARDLEKKKHRSKHKRRRSTVQRELMEINSLIEDIANRTRLRISSRKSIRRRKTKEFSGKTKETQLSKKPSFTPEKPDEEEKVEKRDDQGNIIKISDENQITVSLDPHDYDELFWDGEVLCKTNSMLQQLQMYAEKSELQLAKNSQDEKEKGKKKKKKSRKKKISVPKMQSAKSSVYSIGIRSSTEIPRYLYKDLL